MSASCIKAREDGTTSGSGRWHKYLRGEIYPSRRTILLVESRFPNTSFWIEAPLWRLISDDHVEEEVLANVIVNARPHLATHIKPRDASLSSPITINSLWKQGDLPAFEALLGLIRHAELTSDLGQYVEASWAGLHVASFLSISTPLEAVRDEFLQLLWRRFFRTLRDILSPLGVDYQLQAEATRLKRILETATRNGVITGRRKEKARFAYWIAKQIHQAKNGSSPCETDDLLALYLQKGAAKAALGSQTNFIDALRLFEFSSSFSLNDDRDLMAMIKEDGRHISNHARCLSG